MTNEKFEEIISKQTLITPEQAAKLLSKICVYVGIKHYDGIIGVIKLSTNTKIRIENKPCTIEFKRNRREVRVFYDLVYEYLTNPRYRNEHKYVKGIEDNFDGIYNDSDGSKYYIYNFDKQAAKIYKLK